MSTPEGQIFQNQDQTMSRPTSEFACAPYKLMELHPLDLILNLAVPLTQLPVRASTTLLLWGALSHLLKHLVKSFSPLLKGLLPLTLHVDTLKPSLTSQGKCFTEGLHLPAKQ